MLKMSGVCSDVVYRHIFESFTMSASLARLKKLSNYKISLITVPEYPGILHLHVMWGKNKFLIDDRSDIKNAEQMVHIRGKEKMYFEVYDPSFRQCYMHLPPYVSRLIQGCPS
jgi:hypothetical protein